MSTEKQIQSPEGAAEASERCELRIGGMDCPSCADHVKKALDQLEGVQDVDVEVMGGKVRVSYAAGKLARGDLAGAIRRIGYQVADDEENRRVTFVVDGMDCADEVRQIEGALSKLPGVTDLQFNLLNHQLTVQGSIAQAEIGRALRSIGMTARVEGEEQAPRSFWEKRGRVVVTVVSGFCLALGLILEWLGSSEMVSVPLFVFATVSGGWFIVPRGVRAMRGGALDMNFLMSVAAVGAALIGEWAEGASAMFLFSVAQLLESYSMDRARNAIKALMDLSPTEATVKRDGQEETIPAADVRVGEVIIIRPGQKIPLDGEVVAGHSAASQAPITGESMPVEKEVGSQVFAGSLNEQGSLEVRVTKHVEDTTLARIIHAVEEAQSSRAPSQSFVDRFARIYTPAIVALAVLVFILPPLMGFGSWGVWFYRALAMLVIACPCALVISTPVTIVSGLAGAARRGILVKGGVHLENAGHITAVAFDKTGTLTEGKPVVTDIVPLNGKTEDDLLRLAASVEARSEHPLARSILEEARRRNVEPLPLDEFQALIGRGVRAKVEGRTLYLGNKRLIDEQGKATPETEAALERLESEGKTSVVLFADDGPIGLIAIADRVREGAKAAIHELRNAGVKRVLMLTGDNAGTAAAVARELGIDDYRAKLLPDDKVSFVRELTASGEKLAFVGDGVNDAPALAAATVGIAMGAAGTDIALETADIALMGDDLGKLPLVINAGRKTLAIVKQNITFSLALKAVFLVLAVFGWATLWMAVASDMGASLVVIANGLRALRV